MVDRLVKQNSEEKKAYDKLVELCLGPDSEKAEKILHSKKSELSGFFKEFYGHRRAFYESIEKLSITVFIAAWADSIRQDKGYSVDRLRMMSDLVERKFLLITSLRDFAKQDLAVVLDDIRCYKEWTIDKREEVIVLYLSFVSWLSKETFGYVSEGVDADRVAAEKRQVSFKVYTDLLDRLDLRERILAKIFYLGGSRGLEEVLSLKIEDVDFRKKKIRFPEEVSYRRHLFEDIKEYIQTRKKGYVFTGKGEDRISHTTSFRALKKVTTELKLAPDFTFKDLTK